MLPFCQKSLCFLILETYFWRYYKITFLKSIYKGAKVDQQCTSLSQGSVKAMVEAVKPLACNTQAKIARNWPETLYRLPVCHQLLSFHHKAFFWYEKHLEKISAVRPITTSSLYCSHWKRPCFFWPEMLRTCCQVSISLPQMYSKSH